MMRIITGTARGIRLQTLEGETTRPTPERVKEAVFSMLQFDIEDRTVLDLFAGSGQMALEALSRGAARALLCDNDADAFEILKTNAKKTGLYEKCRILKSNYKDVLRGLGGKEKFDLIFLDPPYQSDFLYDSLKRILVHDVLSFDGMVICESEKQEPIKYPGYREVKFARYGRVCITILAKEEGMDNA